MILSTVKRALMAAYRYGLPLRVTEFIARQLRRIKGWRES